jgi:hypothetical protein
MLTHAAIKSIFTHMTERRMADVVCETRELDQVRVDH